MPKRGPRDVAREGRSDPIGRRARLGDVKLEDLIDLMIRKRVLRVQMPDTTEVELHTSAFAPAPSLERLETASTDTTDRCGCGHSLHVEHNQMGCLLGCSNNLCAGEQEARA